MVPQSGTDNHPDGHEAGPPITRLRWLSAGALAAAALSTVLSWALAAYLPTVGRQAADIALLRHFLPASFVSGAPLLADWHLRAVAYFLPVTISTLLAALICVSVRRHQVVTASVTDHLYRRALWLVPIGMMAMPLFTKDFWLSIGWGRMIAAGVNPYRVDLTATFTTGLPLDLSVYAGRMTYGPLWAALSGLTAWLAHGEVLLDFLLAKGLLAGAWVGTLFALRSAGRLRSERHAAMAVALWGFLPASTLFTMAEGHNGVEMAAFLAAWAWATLSRRDFARPLALAASVLSKYVTAPLVIVDLLVVPLSRRVDWRRYWAGTAVAVAASLAFGVLLLRDPSAFGAVRQMQTWDWWGPDLAIVDAAASLGVAVDRQLVLLALYGCAAAAIAWSVLRRDSMRPFTVELTVQLVVLLLLLGHFWPWYAIWGLPLGALLWDRWAGRLALSLVVASPVLNLAWIEGQTGPILGRRGPLPPHVLMYAMVGATLLLFAVIRLAASEVPAG